MSDTDKELKAIGYPQHILDGFSNGVLLDLRARFAMQLLTSSPIFAGIARDNESHGGLEGLARHVSFPPGVAKAALDISEALFKEAEARGWVTPIDHTQGLPEEVVNQAGRIGAFEVFKQIGAQAAAKAAQPMVAPVGVPGFRPKNFNG